MAIPGVAPEDTRDRQVEFIDDPLPIVTQDNLDITCEIGGRQYDIVDVEVVLTDDSSSNYVDGVIVPDGHNTLPDEGETITIDVDNELMEVREDVDGEITRIFTGIISNASRIEKGAYEFMAFWPGFNELQNGQIIITPATPILEASGTFDGGGASASSVDFTTRRQYADDIAEQIGRYVTKDTDFDFTVNMQEDGYVVNGIRYGDNIRLLVNGEQVPLVVDGSDEGLLERIVKATNSVWEIDRYGNFHIGPPTPDGDFPTSVTSHKLRYITETSAGIQSPAWGSIVVIGDGVVSQDGWGASAQIEENPYKLSSPLTGDATIGVSDDLAEPVFEYTNLEINTAEEAQNVLEKLREEIIKQRGGGTVTVVGHPELWPGDAIQLPDSENQPYAAERFAISKVTHRLNNSDGFLTKVEVMGATNSAESTFSNEIDVPQDKYDAYYTDREIERLETGDTFGL